METSVYSSLVMAVNAHITIKISLLGKAEFADLALVLLFAGVYSKMFCGRRAICERLASDLAIVGTLACMGFLLDALYLYVLR